MEGFEKLPAYLSAQWSIPIPEFHIKAFKGGFSNLTYLISLIHFPMCYVGHPSGIRSQMRMTWFENLKS